MISRCAAEDIIQIPTSECVFVQKHPVRRNIFVRPDNITSVINCGISFETAYQHNIFDAEGDFSIQKGFYFIITKVKTDF